MKAKSVNDVAQNFTRGSDPYKKLKIGSYDAKTAVDNMTKILSLMRSPSLIRILPTKTG